MGSDLLGNKGNPTETLFNSGYEIENNLGNLYVSDFDKSINDYL
jgi:hypothetical protein